MPPTPRLLHPERAAHATIRGFLYQTCLGAVRWLELGAGEILICEGDEDLDRLILGGGGVSEQVKAYSGSLGVGDRAVRESLRNFLLSYVALRRRGEERRFRFITTARRRPSTGGGGKGEGGGPLDVLSAWQNGELGAQMIDAVRTLLASSDPGTDGTPAERRRKAETDAALEWLDRQGGGWERFLTAVEWSFEAPDLPRVRQQIRDGLVARKDGRHLPAEPLVDRLIVALLEASSRPEVEKRLRTAADLDRLLAEAGRELASWTATPAALRIRTVFEELERIGSLLHDNTDELPPDPSPAKLLTAAYEVVPFEEGGRRGELDRLATWCNSAHRRSVLLLSGAGGSGKTRLLIEWCRRLRQQGWHAGFLRQDRGAGELDPLLAGAAPRLVVVDYAETRPRVVEPLLLKMGLGDEGIGPKMRLALVARQTGDWWDQLARSGERQIEDLLLRSPQPVSITPLIEGEEGRRHAFALAAAAFARQLGMEVPADLPPPELGVEKGLDRALYFHMAAMAALRHERIETGHEALQLTLRHERLFWEKQVRGLGLDEALAAAMLSALEAAMAALTLAGGAGDVHRARALLEAALPPGGLRPDLPAALDSLLRRLYGAAPAQSGGRLEPLRPHILGEELIAEFLPRDEGLLTRLLAAASHREMHSALTVMTRLARRSPAASIWLRHGLQSDLEATAETALEVARETGDPAGPELARAIEQSATVELVDRLDSHFQDDSPYGGSVPLREVAWVLAFRRAARARELASSDSDAFRPDLAMSLNNLSVRLGDLGRREQALAAIEEAVKEYRELAFSRPDAFRPDLAMSLNNLSNRLGDLGRREQALDAVREAVRMLGPYFMKQPSAFGDWMRIMAGQYQALCEVEEGEEDPDLDAILKLLRSGDPQGTPPA